MKFTDTQMVNFYVVHHALKRAGLFEPRFNKQAAFVLDNFRAMYEQCEAELAEFEKRRNGENEND